MACMSLVAGGFMPKSTLVRMPNTRLCYQRKTLIISAGRGPDVSHGGGGQTNNGGRKPKDAANVAKEKLPLGGFNSEKEKKKKSEEKVDDGTTVDNEATG
ncbi:hypothetical protein POPTR_001G387000v4 [Populus trichocarpa]|uniref:Uncharacterized protein n=1 Tax=Populus trichocarpa TaxID=3694 RepID=U5GSV5_POPTR|nr:hypothetical protein POPTR_001G387000v4 [Populus trichocarpa]